MDYPQLFKASIIKRYKRFLADVKLDNDKLITCYLANTGSMKSCFETSSSVYLSKNVSSNPKKPRKYPYTLEFTTSPYSKKLVNINTHSTNKIIYEALLNKSIDLDYNYDKIIKEPKINSSTRLDFLLTNSKNHKLTYIETKHVTYFDHTKNTLLFPDAISVRAKKHLQTLIDLSKYHKCILIFFIARNEGKYFTSADHIDNDYGMLLRQCMKTKNLRIMTLSPKISKTRIKISKTDKNKIKLVQYNKIYNSKN